jgi:hypothetical protein
MLMNTYIVSSRSVVVALLAAAAMLSGCVAQQGPDIRVNTAPNADLASYATFGFPEQTGTDRGGYETFVTDHFKAAVREQMEARGYQYVDENPDLLVNFYANVRERTDVRSSPAPSSGYYGYRYGLYGAWPLYENDIDTVTYPVGTANIDIVDADRKQLIWEGVAQGKIRESDLQDPEQAIEGVVTELFTRFPGRPGMADNDAESDTSTQSAGEL